MSDAKPVDLAALRADSEALALIRDAKAEIARSAVAESKAAFEAWKEARRKYLGSALFRGALLPPS